MDVNTTVTSKKQLFVNYKDIPPFPIRVVEKDKVVLVYTVKDSSLGTQQKKHLNMYECLYLNECDGTIVFLLHQIKINIKAL